MVVEGLKTEVLDELYDLDVTKSVEIKRKIGLDDLASVSVHRTRSKKVKR